MKKLTILAFALALMAMTFVACGGGETEEAPPAATTAEPAAAPAEPAAEPAAPEAEAPAEGEAPAGEAAPKAQ